MFLFGGRWAPCRKTSNHNWGDASGPDPSVAARRSVLQPSGAPLVRQWLHTFEALRIGMQVPTKYFGK